MKRFVSVMALATLALATSAARATVLNTPLVRSGGSSAVTYDCQLVNVSDVPITGITVTLVKPDGTSSAPAQFDIPPGFTNTLSNSGSVASGLRCRVEGKFSRKKLVVTMQLVGASGITQLAAPAQ